MDYSEMNIEDFNKELANYVYIPHFPTCSERWDENYTEPVFPGLTKLIQAAAICLRKHAFEIKVGNFECIQESCMQLEQVLLCIPSGDMTSDVSNVYCQLLDALASVQFPVTTIVNHAMAVGFRQSSLRSFFNDLLCPYDTAKIHYFLKHAHDKQFGFSLQGFRLTDLLLSDSYEQDWSPQALLHVLRYGCTDILKKRTAKRPISCTFYDIDISENDLMISLLCLLSTACYTDLTMKDEVQSKADCIKIIFRSIYTFSFEQLYALSDYNLDLILTFEEFKERSLAFLTISGRFPECHERLGSTPISLKHLCKLQIRQLLYKNWALPDGIKLLGVTHALEEYLDLKTD